MLGSQLGHRLLAFHRFHGHFGLEVRPVPPPFLGPCRLFLGGNHCPQFGSRTLAYLPVQLPGSISLRLDSHDELSKPALQGGPLHYRWPVQSASRSVSGAGMHQFPAARVRQNPFLLVINRRREPDAG